MKYIITLLAIVFIAIISCQTNNQTSGFRFSPDKYPADEYVIDITRDTTLVTKNGALLKIPAGALVTDKGTTVSLAIKEAYTLEQMIKAGLTTQAGEELLSSGGMINIEPEKGQTVAIKQPIRVAIPTTSLDPGMQLYKGKRNENGTINWADPDTLPRNPQQDAIMQGQQLFERKCSSCHGIGKEGSGPDLAHFPKRFPLSEGTASLWYHSFDQNGIDIVNSHFENDHESATDIYSCNLINHYNGPVDLRSLFGLNIDTSKDDNSISSVYNYIQYKSDKENLQFPAHANLYDCADSCYRYKNAKQQLNQRKDFTKAEREQFIKENGGLVIKNPDSTWLPGNTPPPPDIDEKVSPNNYESVYYQFTIDSFGWFNIDMLIKGQNAVEESELFVRIVGEYRQKIKVYLVIPSVKVYAEGGPSVNGGDEYAFQYKNGKLPLPQQTKAYILAMTEASGSVVFGVKEFMTGRQQTIDLSLQQSTMQQFEAAVQSWDTQRLHINVNESKNAGAIRQADTALLNIDKALQELEREKPKGCDCDCLQQVPAQATDRSEKIIAQAK